jgi:hypothetical protein
MCGVAPAPAMASGATMGDPGELAENRIETIRGGGRHDDQCRL